MSLRFFRRLIEPAQAHAALEAAWVAVKPYLIAGHRLEVVVRPETRSGGQNDLFHKLCHAAEKARLEWAGKARDQGEWKMLLISGHAVATNAGAEIVAGLEGELLNIRESSASMSRARGASLIEYSLAFLAAAGVQLPARDEETIGSGV